MAEPRTLYQLLAALASGQGQAPNFNNATQQELGTLFPFATDPTLASSNMVRSLGYNPAAGNPFTNYLQSITPDMAELASDFLTAQGNQQAGAANIANATAGKMHQGQSNFFANPNEGRNFLQQVRSFQNQMGTGNLNNPEQTALATKYADPLQAFTGMINSYGSGISPFLTGNSSLLNKTYQNMKQNWTNGAQPNQSFLSYLMG